MTDSACATQSGKIATTEAAWRPALQAAHTCLPPQRDTERARLGELNCDGSGTTFACTYCGEPLLALDATGDLVAPWHWGAGRPSLARRALAAAATKHADRPLARRIEGRCARRNARLTHAFPSGRGTTTRLTSGLNSAAVQFRPGGT